MAASADSLPTVVEAGAIVPYKLASQRRETDTLKAIPSIAPVALEDFPELRRLCARSGRAPSRRDEYRDVTRALLHAARLLWGERVIEPIRLGQKVHRRQVLVLAVALDQLLHPDKSRDPKHGSEQYTVVARRRAAHWFWAATFAGYAPRTEDDIGREADRLAGWARDIGPAPAVVEEARAPSKAKIAEIRFARRSSSHRMFTTLLARRNPRDLLTGERLEVESHFSVYLHTLIHGHHLFPRKWATAQGDEQLYRRVDSTVNIAAISDFTNTWIGGRAPEEYIERILSLGVREEEMRDILLEHLVDLDDLHSSRFEQFYERRLAALHDLAREVLTA